MCLMRGPLRLRWGFAGFDPPGAQHGTDQGGVQGNHRLGDIFAKCECWTPLAPGRISKESGKDVRVLCVLFFYMNAATECLNYIDGARHSKVIRPFHNAFRITLFVHRTVPVYAYTVPGTIYSITAQSSLLTSV